MKHRAILVFFVFVAALAVVAAPALADVQSVYHGGTYFGDVVVEPGQVVDGDLNVVFGDVTIEGTVLGNVNVVGGDAILQPGAAVAGRINTAGGRVVREVIPWAPNAFGNDAYHRNDGLFWHLACDIIVLLIFLIFPLRTRMALDRLERHPGLCTAIGLLGWVAVIPVAILFCVTIVLIPLVLLELAALVAGVCIGSAAIALLIGRRLFEAINPNATAAPLGALVVGLVLLTVAELVPVAGAFVTLLVGLIGLGAAIVAFVNEQRFAGAPPNPISHPHIGGPPMPAG